MKSEREQEYECEIEREREREHEDECERDMATLGFRSTGREKLKLLRTELHC